MNARPGSTNLATTYRQGNALVNVRDAIRRHRDVILGHDVVHPDRNVCGGVGGCALMFAECEVEQEVTGALEYAAREGITLEVRSPEVDEETTR